MKYRLLQENMKKAKKLQGMSQQKLTIGIDMQCLYKSERKIATQFLTLRNLKILKISPFCKKN